MDHIDTLEDKLGFQFQNRSVLMRALTHRSYLNENPEMSLEDNERLEFLGDAVLDFLVGSYLYHRFPEMDEGELTSLRAALVRANTLAAFAREWDLGEALQVGFGESESGGRERTPILCATFEAVIGAVYLDQGLERVVELMNPLIEPALKKILDEQLHKDAKSEFQVWAQAHYGVTPRYKVVSTSGPDHAKVFTVSVLVDDKAWGTGDGPSKQSAAQAAARQAMLQAEDIEDEEVS
jgi:ribonuclease III